MDEVLSEMIQIDDEETRGTAARVIAGGGVIAFRTDTFYGLGADPFNSKAIKKIRELKGRDDDKPILLLISDLNEVDKLVVQSEFFKLVAGKHWPAPLTLVGVASPEVPTELTGGTNSLGLRLPDDTNVCALVRACGGALTATSANPSGDPPARTAKEVESYFSSGIDLIVDGGEVEATQPSTVLDVSGPKTRLVRDGAVPREALEDLL